MIEALVLEANRGGVVVDVGLRGFVPLSQLVSIGPIDTRERDIPEPVKALVGERLQVCVLERGTAQLSTGDVLSGTVVGVTSYGLFVDVGVADGLVHRSEITWGRRRPYVALSARHVSAGGGRGRGPRAPADLAVDQAHGRRPVRAICERT